MVLFGIELLERQKEYSEFMKFLRIKSMIKSFSDSEVLKGNKKLRNRIRDIVDEMEDIEKEINDIVEERASDFERRVKERDSVV